MLREVMELAHSCPVVSSGSGTLCFFRGGAEPPACISVQPRTKQIGHAEGPEVLPSSCWEFLPAFVKVISFDFCSFPLALVVHDHIARN